MEEKNKMKRGFTLLELIIVIIILGILSTVAFPRYIATLETARKSEALATMNAIREVEQAYFAMNGSYQTTFDATNPIEADIDSNGVTDIYIAYPTSANFTYSIQGSGNSTYAQALRKPAVGGGGRMSYAMCLASNKTLTCDIGSACNPGCPP